MINQLVASGTMQDTEMWGGLLLAGCFLAFILLSVVAFHVGLWLGLPCKRTLTTKDECDLVPTKIVGGKTTKFSVMNGIIFVGEVFVNGDHDHIHLSGKVDVSISYLRKIQTLLNTQEAGEALTNHG